MTLADATKKAVAEHNAKMLGQVIDQLRFRCRMNYQQCQEFVQQQTGLDADGFESLMYQADQQ